MTDDEKKLVMELSLGSISKDEFLRCYPFDVEKDSSHVRKFLQDAYLPYRCIKPAKSRSSSFL
jgi:hypothetical protein